MIILPSLIEFEVHQTVDRKTTYLFLICDSPNSHNLHEYIKIWKQYNVNHVVRVCEPSYVNMSLGNEGISS
jgi:hypothetical protein